MGIGAFWSNFLLDGASTSSSENGQLVLGESESLERVEDTGHVFTINKYLVLISNVWNNNELSEITAIVDPGDSSSFNEVSVDLQIQKREMTLP